MPTYEYFCPECRKSFDIVHKMNDQAPTTCPECAQNGLTRKISQVGIAFKGSGFYINDYARKGENSPESSQSGGCGKPGGCGCAVKTKT